MESCHKWLILFCKLRCKLSKKTFTVSAAWLMKKCIVLLSCSECSVRAMVAGTRKCQGSMDTRPIHVFEDKDDTVDTFVEENTFRQVYIHLFLLYTLFTFPQIQASDP